MKIFPFALLTLLFLSFLCGGSVGLLYDFFDCLFFRKDHKEKRRFDPLKKFLQDFIFCCFSACIICILLFYYNDGDFRAFAVIGFFGGWLTYYFSFGKIFRRVFLLFFKYLFILTSFFLRPFYVFFAFLRKKKKKCYSKVIFLLEKKQKECYNINEIKFLLEKSKSGFIKTNFSSKGDN